MFKSRKYLYVILIIIVAAAIILFFLQHAEKRIIDKEAISVKINKVAVLSDPHNTEMDNIETGQADEEDIDIINEEMGKTEIENSVNSKSEEEQAKIDTEKVGVESPQPNNIPIEQTEDFVFFNEEESSEQITYIGRQPPKGYVEPEADSLPINWQVEYKDTYQSNIVILPDEILEINYEEYEWFHSTSEFTPYSYGNAVQYICYAILTYYDGEIPCDYYVNFDEDIHNRHKDSSKIFEVQTHGERPLNICIDMYNYKICVEEGIKKED